jgi:predicted metal-dependent enzyme (double-stranded beta helix superfamily)
VLRRALADRAYLTKAIGDPAGPGIHALHRSPQLTVLNVIWSPRMVLFPHNHNMWATVGVYSGREDNVFWRKTGATIVAERASAIGDRDVLTLPSDVIHSVINPIARLTGSIHVYGGDFFAPGRSEWDPESLSERPWSLEGAARAFREANACFEAGQIRAPAS